MIPQHSNNLHGYSNITDIMKNNVYLKCSKSFQSLGRKPVSPNLRIKEFIFRRCIFCETKIIIKLKINTKMFL